MQIVFVLCIGSALEGEDEFFINFSGKQYFDG